MSARSSSGAEKLPGAVRPAAPKATPPGARARQFPDYDALLEYHALEPDREAVGVAASLPGSTSAAGGFYGQHDHPLHRNQGGERIAPADPRPRPAMSVSAPTVGARERELVDEVFAANWFTHGPKVLELERRFADIVGVEHAIATNSGTAALHLAMLAAGIGPGDAVLVPALTYIATANVVRYVGAEPVFCDVDRATWCLDVGDAVEKALEASSKGLRIAAALPVHMLGHIAPLGALRAALRLEGFEGITIVEDAAQALGGFVHGEEPAIGTRATFSAGSLGDIGAFSFYGSKIITTGGEGGMLTTNDGELAAAARLYRGQGHQPVGGEHYRHRVVGHNYRMPELAAAVGIGQLERLGALLTCRRAVIARYVELLDEAGLELATQHTQRGEIPAPWMFAILVPPGHNRDELAAALNDAGIGTRPMFSPVHLQYPYMDAERTPAELVAVAPVAAEVAARGLMLPTHANLELGDLERVVDTIANVLRAGR